MKDINSGYSSIFKIKKNIEFVYDEREYQGCTEAEIQELEALHPSGLSIPQIFKDFLTVVGKTIRGFTWAPGFFYSFIMYETEMLIAPKGLWNYENVIPKDALIFEGFDDCRKFIRLSEGNDPSVYFVEEGDSEYTLVSNKFSQYIEEVFTKYNYKDIGYTLSVVKKINHLKALILDTKEVLTTLMAITNKETHSLIERALDWYEDAYQIIQNLYRGRGLEENKEKLNDILDIYSYVDDMKISDAHKYKLVEKIGEVIEYFHQNASDIIVLQNN
ncbi:SMI1/KNR4 family protein [Microscilla marina]|uniref:Knr4/Smi1-like domain-containing protein n=1 Tax=Microscilla marina ATCC 23134 TaxID=313606 RepID=A1ZUI6_MICM2|nr:SMI1/KNR4 family protein [Microscilla marina]EAY26005.1 hypothetical protein M23134_07154 [Microscilla marina ATCC 23134]